MEIENSQLNFSDEAMLAEGLCQLVELMLERKDSQQESCNVA